MTENRKSKQNKGLLRCLLALCMMIMVFTVSNTDDAHAAVRLSRKVKSMETGGKFQLKLKGYRGKKAPKWKVSNRKVLSITKITDDQYQITARKKGKAKVIVKAGGKKYVCQVKVRDAFFSVNTNEVVIDGKSTAVLQIQYMGDGYVRWKVSDTSVVKCSWVGGWSGNRIKLSVSGLTNGTTEVILTADGTKKKLPVTVKVSGIDTE